MDTAVKANESFLFDTMENKLSRTRSPAAQSLWVDKSESGPNINSTTATATAAGRPSIANLTYHAEKRPGRT